MQMGVCCICGLHKELTYEHIPPRGSENKSTIKMYNSDFIYVDSEEEFLDNLNNPFFENLIEGIRYEQYQKGFGRKCTCVCCNTSIKKEYDTEYSKLCNWVLALIQQDSKLISKETKSVKIIFPHKFRPLYFVKYVLAMFAVFYGEELFKEHPDLRKFVLDKNSSTFDSSKYQIYMFLLKSQIIYKCEPASTGSVATSEGKEQLLDVINGKSAPLTLECGAHPFGFVLDIDNKVKRTDLSIMKAWISSNEYHDLAFQLNAFEKNTPMPCQFGD